MSWSLVLWSRGSCGTGYLLVWRTTNVVGKCVALLWISCCLKSWSCNLVRGSNFMERSLSLEANSFSASQETYHILFSPNVHYRVHKSMSRCWATSIHSSSSHPNYCPLYVNPSIYAYLLQVITFRFPNKNSVCISVLPYACHTPHSSQSPSIDGTNDTYLFTYSMKQSHSWEANWFCS